MVDYVCYAQHKEMKSEQRCWTICSADFMPKQKKFLREWVAKMNRKAGRPVWKIVIEEKQNDTI